MMVECRVLFSDMTQNHINATLKRSTSDSVKKKLTINIFFVTPLEVDIQLYLMKCPV